MKRLTVAVAVALIMVVGAMPAFAQSSAVDDVAGIIIDRPPTRVADAPAGTPGAVAQPTPVRAAGVAQLAQTGVDTATAAGVAALLVLFGAAALAGARRPRALALEA